MTAAGDPCRAVELRRDATPYLCCMCGHGEQEHNIEVKTVPCSIGACGCRLFRLAIKKWRVQGWVIEPVE